MQAEAAAVQSAVTRKAEEEAAARRATEELSARKTTDEAAARRGSEEAWARISVDAQELAFSDGCLSGSKMSLTRKDDRSFSRPVRIRLGTPIYQWLSC